MGVGFILPIEEPLWPKEKDNVPLKWNDHQPKTHSLMKKSVDPGAAEDEAFYFFQDLSTSVESNAVTNPALMVADAATSMVISACYRNPDYDTADNDNDDEELAPDSYETSYTCASAAAGAMNWMPVDQANVEARRAFWMWYLDEAIPAVLSN